jgi:hypothetical protein
MSGLVTAYEIPAAGSAEVSVLHSGYVGRGGDDERVSGTVTPEVDPLGGDQAALLASSELLISFADVVIPGHGAPFRPRKSA